MNKMEAYKEFEERLKKDIEFWFSQEGKELQLNAVAQGYEDNLFNILMVLFGSGFSAINIIKNLREEIKCT
jgi:hypothetical protein